ICVAGNIRWRPVASLCLAEAAQGRAAAASVSGFRWAIARGCGSPDVGGDEVRGIRETIRTRGGRTGRAPGHTAELAAITALSSAVCSAPAQAQDFGAYLRAFTMLERHEVAALALTLGPIVFPVVTALMLVRTRPP